MKKILYAAMLLLGLSILSSCNKENNGNSGNLIGAWKLYKAEVYFDNKLVCEYNSFEEIEEEGDGLIEVEDIIIYDDGTLLAKNRHSAAVYPYLYDSNNKTLQISFLSYSIEKLTPTDMILCMYVHSSQPNADGHEVGTYEGKTIYQSDEHDGDYFYYNSSNEKIYIDGYGEWLEWGSGYDVFDRTVYYYKKVK